MYLPPHKREKQEGQHVQTSMPNEPSNSSYRGNKSSGYQNSSNGNIFSQGRRMSASNSQHDSFHGNNNWTQYRSPKIVQEMNQFPNSSAGTSSSIHSRWDCLTGDQNSDHKNNPQTPEILTEDKIVEEEKLRNPAMFSKETTAIEQFYSNNSHTFRSWAECRSRGYANEHISRFFNRKNESKQSQNKRMGAFEGAEIGPIFKQFYNYAIDIDNGLAYTERAKEVAISQGSCWFLDFGFAPGGMADLLLNSHEDIKGVGVSLEPEKGGNVYLDALDHHDRFWTLLGDVIELARDDCDLKKACNLPDDFEGFDLVVIGITIHQKWEGDDMNELKGLLHFAQQYFAIKYCKPGAMVMMRMHMSVRLVDCHFLALMLTLFDIERFPGLNIGRENSRARLEAQEQKAASKTKESASMECSNVSQSFEINRTSAWLSLDKTAVATKPFSTFSMRKTYWVIYHGFHCSEERRADLLLRLKDLVGEGTFAYGWNEEEERFNRPILMDEPVDELLEKYGMQMVKIQEEVWKKQVVALEGFMIGQTDKYCKIGRNCRRRYCNMAHSDNKIIPEVLQALNAVNIRAKSRLQEFGFD